MDITHLKMIREVARQGSLTRAAEHLYFSQSALTHQLKQAEQFFQTQIFVRQKKQMTLTANGKLILEASERIMNEIENTRQIIQSSKNMNAGLIKISVDLYTSYHWLSSFLFEYKRIFPLIEVSVSSGDGHKTIENLLDNTIDVGITEDNMNRNLLYTPVFTDEYMAVTAKTHAWAHAKFITEEDFCSQNYIMPEAGEAGTVYRKLFKTGAPRKIYKTALTEVILQMVKAEMGVAVLPHWVISPYVVQDELSATPITAKGFKRTWYAAVLKNKETPAYVDVFISNLSRHMKNTLDLVLHQVKCA